MPGAIGGVVALKARGHKLILNSYCGRARAKETRAVIEANDVVNKAFAELVFVNDRSKKGQVCLDHHAHVHIDDSPAVLAEIHKQMPSCHLILFENGDSSARLYPTWHCNGWPAVVARVDEIDVARRRGSV
jgi:hypothetical protein